MHIWGIQKFGVPFWGPHYKDYSVRGLEWDPPFMQIYIYIHTHKYLSLLLRSLDLKSKPKALLVNET